MVQELAAVVHFLVQNLQSTPLPEMKIVRDFRSEVTQVGSAKYHPPSLKIQK